MNIPLWVRPWSRAADKPCSSGCAIHSASDVAFAAGQRVDVRCVQWPDRHVLFDAVEVLVAWDRVRGCAQIVTDSSTRRVQ